MKTDLGRALDALAALVWTALPDGRVDFVNRAWSEYFGSGCGEPDDGTWPKIVHPDHLDQLREDWKSILKSATAGKFEARILRFDGQYRWCCLDAGPMCDEEGRVVKWYGTCTDIDDRKRDEVALRDSERHARSIVDSIPGMVAVFTAEGMLERVNQPVLDFYGQTLDDLKLWGTGSFTHPEDIVHATKVFSQALVSGEPFEMEVRTLCPGGQYRWVQSCGFPLRDITGRVVSWYNLLVDVDDRRRAEQALDVRELEARVIVDNIPSLVSILAPSGAFEFVNRQMLDYTGLTLEEMASWRGSDAVHPDDLSQTVECFTAGISSREPFEIEYRMRRSDGVYRWFQGRHRPLLDADGGVLRWCVSVTDIDDRKRAEDELRASERNLKLIIDTVPAFAWSALADGTADFFNQHYLNFLGLTAQQARGSGWTVAVHPDDLSVLDDAWKAMVADGRPGEAEARLRRSDGVYRWALFRANPLRDASGTIVKWYGTNTDIDDRKRTEETLKRSEAFLAEGQHLARMGNFLWRLATDEITWSEPLYRIFDLSAGVTITLNLIGSRVHPEDVPMMIDMVNRAQRGDPDFEYEHRIVMPDQSIKYIHMIAHRSGTYQDQSEYLGAVLDVTQRHVAEQALSALRSELAHIMRVTSLGALTASIAHEVHQPLSGIVTNASTCLRMLASDPPNVDGARETARRTIRDGNRAADVIARLRALFSGKAAVSEPVDLNEAARDVLALSASDLQRNRVSLRTEFDDRISAAVGDRVQLQQVILNLVRNALDAMNAVEDRPRQLSIRTEPDGSERVKLSVRDSGVGLDPERADRLFEAFYTTKNDGMGMGLSVSLSIIESHGGRLWASANDGPGATFAFSIPCELMPDGQTVPPTADTTREIRKH